MMSERVSILAAGLAVGLLAQAVSLAGTGRLEGEYRIHMMNGNSVAGHVTEREDGAYEVKLKNGGVVIIRKYQVKGIEALRPGGRRVDGSLGGGDRHPGLRVYITDEEIEEILAGIDAVVDEDMIGAKAEDLMAPLPLDEESVREMVRLIGLSWEEGKPIEEQGGVLLRPHFAMVYTSDRDSAIRLARRLEAVWKWNVRFMNSLGLPARRPDSKLEIYYFASQKEFLDFTRRMSGRASPGTLGYYQPKSNRSHFFDMSTYGGLKKYRETLTRPGTPMRERRRARNTIDRWVEYQNVTVIQHETGHHIHFNIGLFPRNGLERESSIPVWLVEGTTMMFEVPPSKYGGSLGTLNDSRLNEFKKMMAGRRPDAAWWKLFLIDNGIWYSGYYYPYGWAMVYYLWKEHHDGYAQYMQEVFGREPDFRMTNTQREAEFEKFFGRVDDDWIKDFYKFIDSLHVRPSSLPPEL